MDEFSLLIDLHRSNERQGPGGARETERAVDLADLDRSAPIRVADIGCGTGASTLLLARFLNARITAIDLAPAFIAELEARAHARRLADRITALVGSMDNLPFGPGELDAIWAEGAIYNMGFKAGINNWHRFLKPGGILVVSEITWTTGTRPAELQRYWEKEYPEIATAGDKLRVLEHGGYSPTGFFTLPEHCWLDNYYRPLQQGFAGFLQRHGNSREARAVVGLHEEEIAFYQRYRAYYSYGMYIAKKR